MKPLFDANVQHPILTHLNADNSWLISLPYGPHKKPANEQDRLRYNILIDVWLKGPQVDFHRYFSSQEHAYASSVQSVTELNVLLKDAETAARGHDLPGPDVWYIDAVCCSHEFSDHCHEATLRELPREIPILAPAKAASLIRSWSHFQNIVEIPLYMSNHGWIMTKLPSWIHIGRVQTKGDGPAYLHSALIVSCRKGTSQSCEIMIHTPHGITTETLSKAIGADAQVTLLLHGLHDISLAGSQLNLGKENALKMIAAFNVQYWVPTHDEVKLARGFVGYLLKRSAHTLEIAPGAHPITEEENEVEKPEKNNFFAVENGQSLILA